MELFREDPTSPVKNKSVFDYFPSQKTLEDLIFNWISPFRSISLYPGVDDNEQLDSIFVNFKERDLEDEMLYIPIEKIRESFPKIEPINQAHLIQKRAARNFSIPGLFGPIIPQGIRVGLSEQEEEYLEKFSAQLGAEDDFDLQISVLPRQGAITLALSYATCLDGVGSFSLYIPDIDLKELQEFKNPNKPLPADSYISLGCNYNDPETGYGWGEHYGIRISR